MKVTLHLGATKTGTSALQAHLDRARGKLAQARICYPDIGIAAHAHHLLFAAIHPNAWAMHRDQFSTDIEDRFAIFRDMISAIFAEAEQTGAKHIVLSSEYLWGVLSERFLIPLAAALSGHDVRLVAVLRRQDLWLEASYLQAVKFGQRKSFADWLPEFTKTAHSGSDFAAVIAGWEKALSPRETCVTPYEFTDRTAFTRHIVNLVCDSDVAMEVVPSTAKVANPSPTREGLHALLSDTQAGTAMWRAEGTRATFLFSPDEQRAILERYRATNEALAQRFQPGGPPAFFDMSDSGVTNGG
ncbi:MAG: hypothetical protein ABI459_06425 [Deltaproteobacteria bacterium]